MYHSFMIHLFADGHLGFFQHLAIVNCAAILRRQLRESPWDLILSDKEFAVVEGSPKIYIFGVWDIESVIFLCGKIMRSTLKK